MPGTGEWLSIARTADPDELRERILTGYKGGKPFTPYVPTIGVPSAIDWVLDFGCGVGRNFPYLKSVAQHVVGFDLEPMIERCRALAPEPVALLTHQWETLSPRRFDLIFADLVLQHIEPIACRAYLMDFARMAPLTYVLTRLDSDFNTNVLALVDGTNSFYVQTCVEVEHDSEKHQLRQLGNRKSFSELSRSTEGGHVELVLRSQVFAT
jgi:SAM-dependent methyltransferase